MLGNLWAALMTSTASQAEEDDEFLKAAPQLPVNPHLDWQEEEEDHTLASPISHLQELDFDRGVCIISKGRLPRSLLEPWYFSNVKTWVSELMFDDQVDLVKGTSGPRCGDPPSVRILRVTCSRGIRLIPKVLECHPENSCFVIDTRDPDFGLIFRELSKCVIAAAARYKSWKQTTKNKTHKKRS